MTTYMTDKTLNEVLAGQNNTPEPWEVVTEEEKEMESAYLLSDIFSQLHINVHKPTKILRPIPENDLRILTLIYNNSYSRSKYALENLIEHNQHLVPKRVEIEKLITKLIPQ